jgi:type IX secretion system PorP/SprF family membrane protein
MKTKLIITALLLTTFNLNAQHLGFNMTNKVPLLLNPALTGINNYGVASVFHQNRMPGLSGNYTTSTLSFDSPIKKLHGGLGFYYLNNNGGYRTDNFGISYSYQKNLTRKISLSIGTSIEVLHNQLSKNTGFGDTYYMNITPYQLNTNLGALVFSKNAFFGASVRNISTVDPIYLTTNVGYKFTLLKEKKLQLTPVLSYSYQDHFQSITFKFNTSYKWAHLSIGYRDGDSYLVAAGIDIKNFNINYGYNVTSSKLTNSNAGSHELSLRFKLKSLNKRTYPFGTLKYNFDLY